MATLLERPSPDRRFAALALTALVHALLLLGWQATRRLPSLDAGRDGRRIQWIQLAPPVPAQRRSVPPAPAPAPAQASARARTPERLSTHAHARVPAAPGAPAITIVAPTPVTAAPGGAAPDTPAPLDQGAAPRGGPLVQRALREAGAVARALRKENNPYIVAPPDSPQIRLRRGIEAANEMAAPAWYEAPKIEELVNNTGDGARRTRVISGGGTYCITTRSPATSIDMIEKHGKERITSCPAHESTAGSQEWKTARDP